MDKLHSAGPHRARAPGGADSPVRRAADRLAQGDILYRRACAAVSRRRHIIHAGGYARDRGAAWSDDGLARTDRRGSVVLYLDADRAAAAGGFPVADERRAARSDADRGA